MTAYRNSERADRTDFSPATLRDDEELPVVCTLDPDLLPGRMSEWEAVVARSVARQRLDGGLRLLFRPEEGLAADLAALAQAEQRCCAFFEFTLGIGTGAITLDVRAPAQARQTVEELLGLAP